MKISVVNSEKGKREKYEKLRPGLIILGLIIMVSELGHSAD